MIEALAVMFWTVGIVSTVLFAVGIGAVAWGLATGEITVATIMDRHDRPAELVGAPAPASSPRRRDVP